MIEVKEKISVSSLMMRDVATNTLIELGSLDSRIVVIDDDCSNSMGTKGFRTRLPEQYVNPGIMESQIIGMAAGMAAEGFIPFVNAFGVFATRRTFDQIFLSCAYAGLNVKIIGWDAGVYAEGNGGTHMPFEDTGIMRMIPGFTVIDVCDPTQFADILKQAAQLNGSVYIRTGRKTVNSVYKESSAFKIGRGALLKDGPDVTIIACGLLVAEALWAAELLAQDGIHARVIDMHTIKPIDKQLVIDSAKQTGAIVTAENANCVGGLYAAVTQVLAELYPAPVERVAVEDEFGEVGILSYLQDRYRLNKEHIIKKARVAISRKS